MLKKGRSLNTFWMHCTKPAVYGLATCILTTGDHPTPITSFVWQGPSPGHENHSWWLCILLEACIAWSSRIGLFSLKWFWSFVCVGWAPEWRSGLRHCISVQELSLYYLLQIQALSHPAVIGSPIGRRTTGTASSGVGPGGMAGIVNEHLFLTDSPSLNE